MNSDADNAELDPIEPESTPSSTMNRQVFATELQAIAGSRRQRGSEVQAAILERALEKSKTDPRRKGPNPSIDLGLLGMAFSGGGIRSSTFCFGVLQALNEAGVVKHVDYLSTVSGGGYIGSMWSCFLENSRDEQGRRLAEDPRFKEAPLFKLSHELGREEAKAFQHLRNYANYLMPRGLADVMRFPALLLRGLIVNFIMLLPYLLIAACATIWMFNEQIALNKLGFEGLFSGFDYSPYTPKAIIAYLFLIIAGTVLQSRLRRHGKTSIKWRWIMLGLHTFLLLIVVLVFVLEYQPKAIHYLFGPRDDGLFQGLGEWLSGFSAVSGLLTAAFSAFATTRLSALASKSGLLLVSILVPFSLCLLYFAFIAWAVFPQHDWLRELVSPLDLTWTYLGAAVAIGLLSLYGFDVNATSLHNYYRDSLSRTFLFCLKGENVERVDDVTLGSIDVRKSGGPYHLINAVVNNPDLNEVNLRGRRAEFFIFSNGYTGNNRLGYCETAKLEHQDADANLGTAMAVSAAAAAPNMGQKTLNPFITFLMGMLNLRLGYWLPTPAWVNKPFIQDSDGLVSRLLPSVGQVGPMYFLSELLGLPTLSKLLRLEALFKLLGLPAFANHGYINLSDGGHLENLGVFELLRRRCEYIIAVDAEADPDMTFNGLATMIRLARTDMGIDIDIDTADLRKDEKGQSRRHWALGKINYSDDEVGELLYIKSSVTGSENEYITEYRARNPAFPHQSTGDQFFNEEQFEAYRALGFKATRSLFYKQSPVTKEQRRSTTSHREKHISPVGFASADELFDRLRARNTATLQDQDIFFHLTDHRREIERRLSEPALFDYAAELNFELTRPESSTDTNEADGPAADSPLPTDPLAVDPLAADHMIYAGDASDDKTEFDKEREQLLYQICNEQMQLMERALVGLRLDDSRNRSRRSNIGWMNLFRRWSRSKTFQRIWAASIANYSTAFKLFCIEEFRLDFKINWVPASVGDLTRSEHAFLPDPVAQAVMTARTTGGSTQLLENVFIARVNASTTPAATDLQRASRRDGNETSSFPVALAVIPTFDDVPVLTRFRIRRTYLSIGLTRQLLENLRRHPAMNSSGQTERSKCYFKFENPKDENASRLKRILLHLGYSDHGS
ncbi:patatin-like phospholipase family protein [Pelagibius sp. Alg239-R121]|uniref:patatin-like phospholipase family protein n=1 Tax=Pelagibius sp. Alg239-R121 TaxID=2993448 RepID=UPI0024A6BDD2|nr:patatin-like phospholipase family protein [Pelagibius sp. Alg239-R121]